MAARRKRRAPVRKRRVVRPTRRAPATGSCCTTMSKSWLVICGLVCLVLGILLWKGMWNLEWVIALLLILGGLKCLFFGLKG